MAGRNFAAWSTVVDGLLFVVSQDVRFREFKFPQIFVRAKYAEGELKLIETFPLAALDIPRLVTANIF
jgi:hypothetical protein